MTFRFLVGLVVAIFLAGDGAAARKKGLNDRVRKDTREYLKKELSGEFPDYDGGALTAKEKEVFEDMVQFERKGKKLRSIGLPLMILPIIPGIAARTATRGGALALVLLGAGMFMGGLTAVVKAAKSRDQVGAKARTLIQMIKDRKRREEMRNEQMEEEWPENSPCDEGAAEEGKTAEAEKIGREEEVAGQDN